MDSITACVAGFQCDISEDSKLLSETKLSAKKNDNEVSLSHIFEHDHHLEQCKAQMAQDFAIEHRIFLKAILGLLNERDTHAIEANVNSPKIMKIGHLKKASRRMGLWWTKYIELRKGTLSYFDCVEKQGSTTSQNHNWKTSAVRRKEIYLTAPSCECRPIKHSRGFVFELRIQGGPRRLWMANTPEERLIWIQAIHDAMIGASVTRGDNFLEYQVEHIGGRNQTKKGNNVPPNSPYKEFLDQYLEIRTATQAAKSKDQLLGTLSCLRGKSITVPVQWIKSQVDDIPTASFVESEISSDVEQLWKDLLRDSVEINGFVIKGNSFYGPERIVGQLTQQILFSDNVSSQRNHTSIQLGGTQHRISEAQAISYARDILLACDRTRSGGDSYFCLENLCLNRTLVVLCPLSTEANPLSIKVSSRCQKNGIEEKNIVESCWAFSRSNPSEPWKRQYLVLANGVLNCYSASDQKARQLLEKVILQGAKIASSSHVVQDSKYSRHQGDTVAGGIVNITANDGQIIRELLFEDEFTFIIWHLSMRKSADSSFDCQGGKCNNGPNLYNTPGPACHTVDAIVNVCTEYKMCTTNPSGVESDDIWAALRTTFVQKFTLTGGQNGRIFRGDEVVHLEVL
ncbi:hypothetical protein ACHAXA_008320 [Cyclostephanos tholiformis]|uniref:PH domain-containing protein n=1 Tax=Cyclostephanos tholiformis TaxID=382380 RepID=A0ABD3R773_9STRA